MGAEVEIVVLARLVQIMQFPILAAAAEDLDPFVLHKVAIVVGRVVAVF